MPRHGRAYPIKPHIRERLTFATVRLPAHFYSTSFPATENPMAEGGVWVQGFTNGRDWTDNRTTPAKVFGTQNGTNTNSAIGVTPSQYDDSISVLKGVFGANHYARATVFNTGAAGDYSREVELLMRFDISLGNARGYEVEFSCDPSNPYFDIVRWNGQVADFTPLTLSTGGTHLVNMPGGAAATGDKLEAYAIGNTIYGYKNGVLMASATDSTWTDGNPGLGHYLHNRTNSGDVTSYGFSDYLARTLDVGDWRQTIKRQAVNRAATY